MNKINLNTKIAVLTALSLIAGLFEFVYFPAPWLKFDLSEIIILFAITVVGPIPACLIVVLRSVIRWLITSGTNIPFPFFGELLAITASLYLIAIATPFLRKRKVNPSVIAWFPLLIYLVTIFMTALNYLITTPAFLSKGAVYFPTNSFITKFFKGDIMKYFNLVISTYIPFNMIKYTINFFIAGPIILAINSFYVTWSQKITTNNSSSKQNLISYDKINIINENKGE